MSEPPLVSVVIPTWNRGPLVEEAVRSVLVQTEPRLEVLVCDDASTDDSSRRIAAVADPRVCWLPGAGHGRPAPPRNRGIARARGAWVAFLDSDDTWRHDKLAVQLARAESTGLRAVASNATRVRLTGPDVDYFATLPDRLTLTDLLRVNGVICSSLMVRRELLATTGGFPESPAVAGFEDYCLWLRVAVLTDIACVPAPLVRYRDVAADSLRGQAAVSEAVLRGRAFADLARWGRRARVTLAVPTRIHLAALRAEARLGVAPGSRLHGTLTAWTNLLPPHRPRPPTAPG